MTQYEQAIQELESRGLLVTSWGTGANRMSHCPGPLHGRGDARPSLSVSEGRDGRALLYCHAGCSFDDLCEALGLERQPHLWNGQGEVVAYYVYLDENSEPLFRVARLEPKGFYQERYTFGEWVPGLADTPRVLFNLPGVRKAADAGGDVFLVEGEKDALTLLANGLCGTTTPGGAKNWTDEYTEQLRGANVFIIADLDEPGLASAENRRQTLMAAGIVCNVWYPATGKDATDHFAEGYGWEDFLTEEPLDLGELGPLDWWDYEHKETEWLFRPYVPRGTRVMAFGAAGSLKSLWALWLASKLSNNREQVAYVSLEMTPSEVAKRLRQLDPDPEYFKLFTKFSLSNPEHYRLMRRALRGYALIVIDSWTAAGGADNSKAQDQAVADLDRELFMPLIDETGATLLVIDNTGHGFHANDGTYVPMEHARGSSAKGDKMDVTLWFNRPVETNNYRTKISVKKMRLDEPIPMPVTVETPQDRIEFYYCDSGVMTDRPMWEGDHVEVTDNEPEVAASELPLDDQLAIARLKDRLGATEVKSDGDDG